MKNVYLILMSLILTASAIGQTISITTTNTASICYNDGTLTIHPTGGTAPYIDSILSGPTNPNLTYPIALPSGQNIFSNLPHGTFTVRVHDAAGHSGTFTASVGGTYDFPTDSLYQNTYIYYLGYNNFTTDTLFCLADSNTGRKPYQYAISSTSSNSGFGSYQSNNFFTHLCAGQYWIRLRDSCGNIFTNSYNVTYTLYMEVNCVNYSSGTATVLGQNGVPPYTYHVYDNFGQLLLTSRSGNITGLPPLSSTISAYQFSVTDSCGMSFLVPGSYYPSKPNYQVPCPFTGTINVSAYSNLSLFPPYVFSCLNCSPVQNDTFESLLNISGSSVALFTGASINSDYYIRLTDHCGNTRVDTVHTLPTATALVNFTSCNGVHISFTYTDGSPIPSSDVDSVFLFHNGHWIRSINGIFNHLSNFNPIYPADTIRGYIHGGCVCKQPTSIFIPFFGTYGTMHQDSSCSKIWNLIAATPQNDFPEKIYLVNSFNDTILESPPSANDGSYFYNLQPGHYTLISDSGCSFPIVLDTFKRVWDHVLSYVTCAGQPVIEEYGYDTIQEGGYPGFVTYYGHDFRVSIFHNDSLVYGPDTLRYNNPAAYIFGYIQYHYPSDTGLYTYKVYSMPYGPGAYDSVTQQYYNISLTTPYDTICPIDTGSFIVTRSTVPFPYAQAVYKCNSALASPPMLSIYGGSVPYTVQIPGVDTIIMNTNSIAFPDTSQGTYNIIAYDNCGISRSFTFSIRDSCTCTAPSATWTSTHNGQNYAFNDSIISGSGPYSYSWTFGDGGTSSSPKPGHRYSTAGTYTVTLIIDNACGSDTVRRTITVATGINATSLDEHISVYPNPNHGSFTITVDEVPASALSAEITDVLGRSIFRQDIHIGKNEMSLNIESGLYLVKISDGENSTIRTMSIK